MSRRHFNDNPKSLGKDKIFSETLGDAMPRVGKGKKPVTVILAEDTYEALKLLADARDWSLSQAARNLIEHGLDNCSLTMPQNPQP